MRVRELVENGTLAVTLTAGVGYGLVDDPVTKSLLLVICLGVTVWYIMKGQFLKGWIGGSYPEMVKQIQFLESLIAKWCYSDGREVPYEKRDEILKRYQLLIEEIQSHPDNPSIKGP